MSETTSEARAQLVPIRPEIWVSPEGEPWIVLVGSENLDAADGGQFAFRLQDDADGEGAEALETSLYAWAGELAHVQWNEEVPA